MKTIEERVAEIKEKHGKGYNCAQVVLCAYADELGMDEETLAHIYDRHKVNYHSNGVGVYNVQKRLKLYYGEDYGITYESVVGKGTTVTITIPGRQEGQK